MFDVFQAGLCIAAQLKAMLQDSTIVKVMHDCRQDSAALYYQMGIKLQNIYDTQVKMACMQRSVHCHDSACCCAHCHHRVQ